MVQLTKKDQNVKRKNMTKVKLLSKLYYLQYMYMIISLQSHYNIINFQNRLSIAIKLANSRPYIYSITFIQYDQLFIGCVILILNVIKTEHVAKILRNY